MSIEKKLVFIGLLHLYIFEAINAGITNPPLKERGRFVFHFPDKKARSLFFTAWGFSDSHHDEDKQCKYDYRADNNANNAPITPINR